MKCLISTNKINPHSKIIEVVIGYPGCLNCMASYNTLNHNSDRWCINDKRKTVAQLGGINSTI